jgi:hypothetical protein
VNNVGAAAAAKTHVMPLPLKVVSKAKIENTFHYIAALHYNYKFKSTLFCGVESCMPMHGQKDVN